MKYLITGGSGFIGSSFIKSLSPKEDSVIILSRQKSSSTNNCRFINDLSLLNNDEQIDCIINLAGKPIDCRWTNANKDELIDSRVSITKALATLINRLKAKPKIIVSASAIGFYGNYNNQVLDEHSIGKQSFTHKLCQEWENEAIKLKQYGIRVCIIRLGVVLGKDGGFIKKVYLPFKLGLGGKLGNGKQFFSWIHIDDVTSAIKFLIANNKCCEIYNFTSPNATNNAKITQYIGQILSKPTLFNIPAILIKIIFGEMGIKLLLEGNKVIPTRLLEQGYKFKYQNVISALKDVLS